MRKYELDPNYRKNKEAFFSFANVFVSKINASSTKYITRRGSELFREIFTANDEAFALALLINELQNYERKAAKLTGWKPFTSSRDGDTWSPAGLRLFVDIYKTVVTLRSANGSEHVEEELKQRYASSKKDNQRKKKRDQCDSST